MTTGHKNITFLVGGVAVLTLIINGTTCGWVVNLLGLATPSEGKKKLLAFVRNRIYNETKDQYTALAESQDFAEHSGAMVTRWYLIWV